ncbi:hypothetical protein AA313_de0208640 [Arthrobotrys entomopaga]|nr:hypothetical protein AA313_de0208640 [Arthrobotrys entomopaga]
MASNNGPNRVFLIPEVLEQILIQMPILELITTGNLVCGLWHDVIQDSLVVKRYLRIGIPNLAHAPSFNKNIEPSLTPAGLTYLGLYWTKFNKLWRSFTCPEECVELSQMFFRRFAQAMTSLKAELIVPPPQPYEFLIEVEGSRLSRPFALATRCLPNHDECDYDNSVAQVMHELMFRVLAIWCMPPFRQRIMFTAAPFAYLDGKKFMFRLDSDRRPIACSFEDDDSSLMDKDFKFVGNIGFDYFPGGNFLLTRPREWRAFRIVRGGVEIDLDIEEGDDYEDEEEGEEEEDEEEAEDGDEEEDEEDEEEEDNSSDSEDLDEEEIFGGGMEGEE